MKRENRVRGDEANIFLHPIEIEIVDMLQDSPGRGAIGTVLLTSVPNLRLNALAIGVSYYHGGKFHSDGSLSVRSETRDSPICSWPLVLRGMHMRTDGRNT